jgi:hypothetical protein
MREGQGAGIHGMFVVVKCWVRSEKFDLF